MDTIKRYVRYTVNGREGWAELRGEDQLHTLSGAAAAYLQEVNLLAPVRPSKIVGIGLNYRSHAEEMKKPLPDEPLMFIKPSTAVLDPGKPIVCPSGYKRVDYEGELAVIIGKEAHQVKAAHAEEFIAGYCCLNDITVRDLQTKDVQYTRAKGFDTFAPLGPYLAVGLDSANLNIITRVDGEIRQNSSTADMIFSVPELIEAVSRVMTLLPNDIISTGTPPGVGPIAPGMIIEVEIEGVGILQNPVIAEKQ